MNLGDLVASFRRKTLDLDPASYSWCDDEVIGFYNDAVAEAADRARLILDTSTPAVCEIALTPGSPLYALHPAILAISRVELDSDGGAGPLTLTTESSLDLEFGGWKTQRGRVSAFIDYGDKIRFYRIPVEADAARLQVFRLPIHTMRADTDTPEIPERWHSRLDDWALRCAYRKQDSDVNDPGRAARYEADFERSFGAKRDANVQRKQRTGKPPVVRGGWW